MAMTEPQERRALAVRAIDLGVELRSWTAPRRAATGSLMGALAVAFVVVALAANSPWWAVASGTVVGLGVGASIAGAVRAPRGAEFVVCDFRGVIGAPVALMIALSPSGGLLADAVLPVFALLAVGLAVWTALARIDRRARARRSPDGEVCLDCRPLIPRHQ